jgi:hypothetical protein
MMFDDLVASKPIEISAQDVAFIKALIAGDPRKAFVEDQGKAPITLFCYPRILQCFELQMEHGTWHIVMIWTI